MSGIDRPHGGPGLHGLVFEFAFVGQSLELPLPSFGFEFTEWVVAMVGASGSATFTVEVAPSLTGTYASVGGTQPSVTGATGGGSSGTLNWTTKKIAARSKVRATLATLSGASTATLTLGGRKR